MKNLTRRRVLRGMFNGTAVAVGLPLLNCFLNNNGTALASGAPLPQRFGTWSWGLGMSKSIFVPKKTGRRFRSSRGDRNVRADPGQDEPVHQLQRFP